MTPDAHGNFAIEHDGDLERPPEADNEVLAWHFSGPKLRDGRALPEIGEWLEHAGPIAWCESGLYASRRAIDALSYAPGHFISRVACSNVEREDDSKFVCRRRRVIARLDGEALLRSFARRQALAVAHLWDMPDVVRQYLETGDESLRDAARAAAWAAAWAAVWTAASAAASAAARDAARAAARAAAWDAVRDAARAAARAAAWDAVRDAARAAAWDAVRDAARDAANQMLEEMVMAAMDAQP